MFLKIFCSWIFYKKAYFSKYVYFLNEISYFCVLISISGDDNEKMDFKHTTFVYLNIIKRRLFALHFQT